MQTNKKGFTIIELIVVIAIIAILAAIVLVNVTQYIGRSKTAAIQANLSTIETSMAAYLADPANTDAKGSDINSRNDGCASTSPAAKAILTNAGTGNPTCHGDASINGTAWCAYSATPSATSGTNTGWCVDSAGYHGYDHTACIADTAAGAKCQ